MLFNQVWLYSFLAVIIILVVILIILAVKIRNINKVLSETGRLVRSGINYIERKLTYPHPLEWEPGEKLTASDIEEIMGRLKGSIQQELQFIDLIIDNIMQGVLIINNNREIIRINENLLNLFYLKKEEVLYKKTVFVFKNEKFENLIEIVFDQLVPRRKNIIFYGDEERYLHVEVVPLNPEGRRDEGEKVNLLVLIKNITQEMEFSRLRSQFVANISHEMRTPITSIRGYIDTILEDQSIDRNKIKDYLSRSLKEVEKLNFLIKDVLNLSNIEYKRNVLFEKDYNLVDIINDTIKSLNFLAEKNNIKINFGHSDDTINYRTDEELFTQMVRNIIENSIFYGGRGTEINVDIEESKDKIKLTFRDNGTGIEKDELPYIFQRFYRGKSSRSSKQIGSGLGLSIVKHTVELHNGRISVSSTPDKETIFEVTLPKKSSGASDLN